MSAPFPIVRRPDEADQVPILVSSPHSGRAFPEDLLDTYAVDPESLANDGDLYVDELYAGVTEVGATFVTSPWSRFVVDLNRLRDDLSAAGVEGARARRGPGYYGERGLIWAVSATGDPIYHRPLPAEHVRARIAAYYDPYHAFLMDELRRLRDRFGYAILLDAHSMPSRAAGIGGRGGRRADVVPGDLLGGACGAWLTRAVGRYWRRAGYTVTPNTPYRGGAIVRRHGRPASRIHAIQIELNRRLYMDEVTFERAPTLSAMAERCVAFVASVADVEPSPTE